MGRERRSTRFWVGPVAIGLFLALPACSEDVDPGVGESCALAGEGCGGTPDCCAPLACRSGVCGDRAAGAEEEADADPSDGPAGRADGADGAGAGDGEGSPGGGQPAVDDCVPSNPGSPGGSIESCNGIDDDCDGEIDEDIAEVVCGVGGCQRAVAGCVDGAVPACEAGQPSVEACNGVDDDCDGVVDIDAEGVAEGWACVPPTGPQGFVMGSEQGEPGRDRNEQPHTVVLTRPMLMRRTVVTQDEWKDLMGNNPSWFSEEGRGGCVGDESCGDRPVDLVNWYEAITYVNRLSERDGVEPCYELVDCGPAEDLGAACGDGPGASQCLGAYRCADVVFSGLDCMGYRLPTEAEWEWAARGGTDTAYHSGGFQDESPMTCNVVESLDRVGWYCGNSGGRTHRVGEKDPNGFGLYDVHGNVWEWIWDFYQQDFGLTAEQLAGVVTDPYDPVAGIETALRSGTWNGRPATVRAAIRHECPTIFRRHDRAFRYVISGPSPANP